MAFIETRQEVRGLCIICGEPKYFRQVTCLVNFDSETPFAASLEQEFLAAQAGDHDYYEDCSCTKEEQLEGDYALVATQIKEKTWLTIYHDGNRTADERCMSVKKTGRRSFRVVNDADWPMVKFGPVYRSRKAAEAALASEIEAYKTWARYATGVWAESDRRMEAELAAQRDAE